MRDDEVEFINFKSTEDTADTTHEESEDIKLRSVRSNPTIQSQFNEMKVKIKDEKERTKKGKKNVKTDQNELRKEIKMDEHIIPIEELEKRLGTDCKNGLSHDEAEKRINIYGRNMMTPPKSKPKILIFLGYALAPFSIFLWIASILCFIAYGLDTSSKDNLLVAVVLIAVILLTSLFSYLQSASSAKVIESFKKMVPLKTKVIRNGRMMDIDVANLTVGDLVEINLGEKIPADIRIIEAAGLKVDNSSLTGETDPISKGPQMTDESPLETKNLAFYLTSVVSGRGRGIVVKTGDNTMIGRIASLATQTSDVETPIRKEMNSFVLMITVLAIALAIPFFIAGWFLYNIATNIVFLVGILVANVPEGVLVSISVCLTLAAKKMAAKNVIVKNLESVETLGSTSVICSDKTGTLTMNQMTVYHLWYDGEIVRADDKIPGDEKSVDLKNPVFQMLSNIAALNNNATFKEGEEGTNGDASESSLIKFCQPKRDILEWRKANPRVIQIPFNSTNKYQVSVHKQEIDDPRHLNLFKGAPERVLQRCTSYYRYNPETKSAEVVKIDEEWKKEYQNSYENLGERGERVLGFAFSYLDPEIYNDDYKYDSEAGNWPTEELTFVGLISMIDPPRPAVPEAVRKCREAGIRVVMVTGDHPITAKAIAKQVGIITGETKEDVAKRRGIDVNKVDLSEVNAVVIHGTELAELTDEDIDNIFENYRQIVFARTSPQQKMRIVEGFQRRGDIVAVTGDGVNDSPALKRADIGVAMGSGSEVSKEAANMILLDDNFASIVRGVEEGRVIFDNLKKTIAYILSANFPQIVPFFLFVFIRFPLPLTTILMLCVCVGTDMLPAISLSYEKAETDIMQRRPRDPKVDKLVTVRLISFSYFQAGFIIALCGLFTYFVVMGDFGFSPKSLPGLAAVWDKEDKVIIFKDKHGDLFERNYDYRMNALRHAQTAVFVSIVLCQWGTLLMTKTRKLSLFQQGMKTGSPTLVWSKKLCWRSSFAMFLSLDLSLKPNLSLLNTG